MKTSGKVMLVLIALVWILAFYSMGFNGFAVFFAVIGTFFVMAGLNGWVKAKGDMYLANKYDESKRQ